MYPKYKKWLFLAIVVLIPILSGCDGCDKDKYIAPPPAPSAPSNLVASAISSTRIDLYWQDNSTNEDGFHLYRRTTDSYSKVAILDVNATSYNDTGLSPETTYQYKVKAYNDGGESGSSNAFSVTTPAGPEPEPEPEPEPLKPATDMRADVISYKLVLLSWTDNSSDEDGFRVRCRMDETVYLTIATVGPNSTLFRHNFIQPMTALEYYVEVYRGDESIGSEQAYATTFEAPVEILDYSFYRVSNRKHLLHGHLKSEATEPCSVELTAEYHITRYYDDYSEWETCIYTVDLEALADSTFFEFVYILEFPKYPTAGDKLVDCTLEITDVEIEY